MIDPTNVDGLGSKYRLGYGEPYDLATAGLSQVTHVRLVDIVGNGSRLDSQNRPIYDPHPVAQSAGFDLEAVAALNFRTWRTLPAGTFSASGTNATAMTHRPDGRLVLGRQGNLLLQDSWGQPQLTALPLNGITLDPSFVAARDLNNLLVGAGGSSSGGSGIHAVAPTSGIVTSPLATLQNFAGCYWKSSLSHREGWIIAGSNASGSHNLTYVSLDGTVSGALTQTLCSYSAGVATDSAGNLYAGLYELLPFPPYSDDTNRVLKWDITEVDAAVASLETSTPVPLTRASSTPLFQFDGAASVTIDAWGRVWATGFASSQLQVYDPTTGSSARFTPDHDPLPGVADVIYQVAAFNDPEGIPSLAFLAQDEIGTAGTPIVYGTAPLTALRVPQDASSWRQHHFGFSLPPAEETTVWGDAADPDQDGLPNLLERVLGRHPLHSDSAQAIEVEVTLGRLRSDFIIDPDAEGAALILEGSNTLAPNDWFTLAELHGSEPFQAASGILVTTRPEGRWTRVTVTDNQFLSSTPQRFVRLRAQPLP